MPSGRIRSNAAIWAGNSGADEVGHSDRKEGIEGGLKERRRAAPSGGIAHKPGFGVEFSLAGHQDPTPRAAGPISLSTKPPSFFFFPRGPSGHRAGESTRISSNPSRSLNWFPW